MDYSSFCYWESCCRRKVRFSHADHAERQIRRIFHFGEGADVHTLVTYRCVFCLGYHIGHDRNSRLI
jgi:hypothetical protein